MDDTCIYIYNFIMPKLQAILRFKLYSKRVLWYSGFMQESRDTVANAIKWRFCCIKPSIYIIAGWEQFKTVTRRCQSSNIPVMEVPVKLR